MDPTPQQVRDSGTTIQLWQTQTTQHDDYYEEGTIGKIAKLCIEALECLIGSLSGLQFYPDGVRALRKHYITFKLWENGHEAMSGRLDRLLDGSQNLRRTLLGILHPLCKALQSAIGANQDTNLPLSSLAFLEATRKSFRKPKGLLEESDSEEDSVYEDDDNISWSGSDTEKDTEIEMQIKTRISVQWNASDFLDLVTEVKIYTDCLVDLNIALRYLAPDIAPGPIIHVRSEPDWHIDLVSAKFSKASRSPVEKLGVISWERYLRMRQTRESAIAIEAAKAAGLDFKDSGIGTMSRDRTNDSVRQAPNEEPVIYSSAAYANTILSFVTNLNEEDGVPIPPLPEEAKNGKTFTCDGCGRTDVIAVTNRAWRFSTTAFASRELWVDHLKTAHQLAPSQKVFECPLCLEGIKDEGNVILKHIARHLETISLAAFPRPIDLEMTSEDSEHTSNVYDHGSAVLDTISEEARSIAQGEDNLSPLYPSIPSNQQQAINAAAVLTSEQSVDASKQWHLSKKSPVFPIPSTPRTISEGGGRGGVGGGRNLHTWNCNKCGACNMYWFDMCPVCKRGINASADEHRR
ncbi:hypothetical protein OPT61_g4411 [Boeremia exigua]|uniref:Uncharacterized protein n=1 Tax=Boeremia exigua TaxID=749465 RepID=A0ACC2IE46_9PLEO|nr:hypothetical protein OPT61_g4411 [Boeremia exigua]